MEENTSQTQIPQQAVQQVNNVQTPPSPKPKKKFIIIGIAIVALLLIAGSSFAAYQFVKKPQTQQVACTLEAKICPDGTSVGRTGPNCSFAPCPLATPTPDPTASWKTYVDSRYGFSLKYPPSWNIPTFWDNDQTASHPFDPSFMQKSYTVDFSIRNNNKQSINQGSINAVIEVAENPELWSLNKWIKQLEEMHGQKLSTTNTIINGQQALKTRILPDFSDIYTEYTYTQSRSTVISFSLNGNGEGGSNYQLNDPFIQEEMDNFNTMLSTFKFIDSQIITPSPTSSQKISCNTNSDCPSGDTCTVWGPVRIDGPQNKYCTAPGQAVPL